MRGVFTAHIEIASLAAAKTALLGECSANICLEILEASIRTAGGTVLENLIAGLFRVTTKGSPAGSAVNVQKDETGDASTVVTWLGDLSAEPTTYDAAPLDATGMSNLEGYVYSALPEDRKIVSPSKLFGLRLRVAPVTAFKAVCMVKYREIGG